MKLMIGRIRLSIIDMLGLLVLATILLSLAAPELAPDRLRNIVIPAQRAHADVSLQADCLWLQARNHGFYDIQQQTLTRKTPSADNELWQGFLQSIGEHECGSPLTDMAELRPALLASLPDAERHFRSQAN